MAKKKSLTPKPNLLRVKPSHIPALSPERLADALAHIDGMKVPESAKKQLKRMLQAASNPQNDHPAIILKTLEETRQKNASETEREVESTFAVVTTRGRAALVEMDADEWDRLVDDANPSH